MHKVQSHESRRRFESFATVKEQFEILSVMRVPDLSATAGNAGQITHIIGSNATNQHFSLSAIEGIEFNKNGNWLSTNHINPCLYLPRNQTASANVNNAATAVAAAVVYSSSADEFVQKALSSAQTAICDYNTVNSQRLASPPRHAHSLPYTKELSSNNTYSKTFSDPSPVDQATPEIDDPFNADLDHLNTTQSREIAACGTVLDPFVVRPQPSNRDTTLRRTLEFRFDDNNGMPANRHTNNEFVSEDHLKQPNTDVKLRSQETPSTGFALRRQYDGDSEHDYNDQSMLDLCNESYNKAIQNHNDDLDEYLTSPTSSSISSNTPRRSYFPRGIINPNYPGFQHLAHTLSEHFVGCLPSDSYDSDMSEYEMELSADSFDELPDERQVELNMKLNIYNNNSGNSHNNARAISSQSSAFTDANSNNNSGVANGDAHDLDDNLKIVLTLDAPGEGKSAHERADENETCWDAALKSGVAVHKDAYSITPDILIKNHDLHVEPRLKKENRPDLLRGVSPRPIRSRTPNPDGTASVDCGAKPMPTMLAKINPAHAAAHSPRKSDLAKDEVCFGMTPVDIIGDFEQEVEREFGLLVSGYRRLMDAGVDDVNEDNLSCGANAPEKLSDAALSGAKDHIDSHKFLIAFNRTKDNGDTGSDTQSHTQIDSATNTPAACTLMDFIEDNNAVDWSYGTCEATANEPQQQQAESKTHAPDSDRNADNNAQKPKYQKSSYDERQLPPVAIEYKRCQQSARNSRKSQNHEKAERSAKGSSSKVSRNHTKTGFTNRYFNAKRGGGTTGGDKSEGKDGRKREEAELHQYQQLISDKELILSNSRYAKLSVWAQYLKNSVNDSKYSSSELVSPSALDLFDAYKIGTDFDMETLQKHLKMAKEIEKKRRSDREEIRRRLAMGAEENCNEFSEHSPWKPSVQSRMPTASIQFGRLMDACSDTESHSSDSETCPKLSKTRQLDNTSVLNISLADKPAYCAYGGRSISSNSLCTNKTQLQQQQKHQQQQQPSPLPAISNEDRECDFFTKQARLQIEARMALAQAKEMAHMQMEIERQNQRVSPITDIIHVSLRKVGVQMTTDKRRVSRQMLTDMNIAQLQILVNSLHTHIEELNEALVHNLMERDDLHVSQDSMLVDIEELTRYIGENEQLAQQYKKPNLCNQAI